MLVYAGVDEAGYGPMFGPLTVACAVLTLPANDAAAGAPKLWSMLRGAVAKQVGSAKGRIVVCDSKRLKRSAADADDPARHPLAHLERGVLAFLRCVGATVPESDRALIEAISPGAWAHLEREPWYGGPALALPLGNDATKLRIDANVLSKALERANVGAASLRCHALSEAQFNEAVGRVRTKSAASFHLVGRHLAAIMDVYGEHHPRVVVDRQGARMRYREPLQMLFPEAMIRILDEQETISRYELALDSKRMTITFTEKAETSHLPVALASMLAKYLREVLMIRFNRYFAALRPELKPTAGYVEDGRRFLADIEDLIESQRLPRERLVRCC
ncbi:MAG: hypothetical protein KJZ69_02890 [Phycisphaerales bacterium]|nr:hypothetical protein [Phycisphaerales bacterium]